MTIPNSGEDTEKLDHTDIAGGDVKMVQLLWKIVWQVLRKLNMHVPFDPAILRTDVHPTEMKTHIHTKICTQTFTAVFSIIRKYQKQLAVRVDGRTHLLPPYSGTPPPGSKGG